MRTALPRLQQQRCLYRLAFDSCHCYQQTPAIRCKYTYIRRCSESRLPYRAYHHSRYTCSNQSPYTESPAFPGSTNSAFSSSSENVKNASPTAIPRVAAERRRDPDAWIELFDAVLPLEYRKIVRQQDDLSRGKALSDAKAACTYILKVLDSARIQQHANVDLLAHMVLHGQKDAALYILKLLLDNLASNFPARSNECLPSNIHWPETNIFNMCRKPIEVAAVKHHTTNRLVYSGQPQDDPRYTFMFSKVKQGTMTQIWSTLGSLVIHSADLPGKEAAELNNVLMLVLGQIHNLDLVPENVYAYRRSSLPVSIQKPPILHLVSSRILTALSDAIWRQQQDFIIEKAARLGMPYEEIGRDPPGGRFRLKVRPLDAEIWLEFILWCCVEGGFTSAGARILRRLKDHIENPWYAVTWSSSNRNSTIGPIVDWSRVRARYGGSVGLKEGYSGDKPFVEMPHRTISTEVVLGLVDASINTINNNIADSGGVAVVQRTIFDMVSFLEPHDLPIGYFDYLTIRLMQTGVFRLPQDADALRAWYRRLGDMKTLETLSGSPKPTTSLSLDSLLVHSETYAGLLHQVIDAYVQSGNVHRALDSFNVLQEVVDASKLQAIDSFINPLSSQTKPADPLEKPPVIGLRDFVGSHGELPLYKLMGLLELASDTGLNGFGQWLLYNENPDGPLVPQSAYQNPGVARTLVRFAALTRDGPLVEQLLRAQQRGGRQPTVAFLRALINTDIIILNFKQAEAQLRRLTLAQGGGFGLTNFANLASVILRLESGNIYRLSHADNNQALRYGRHLLSQMLAGALGERSGSFRTDTRKVFRLQIGGLLRIFQDFPKSSLKDIAKQYAQTYPAPNAPCLSATNFNIFLEAVLQCEGPARGVQLWDHFCQSPAVDAKLHEDDSFSENDFFPASHELDGEDNEGASDGIVNGMSRDVESTSAEHEEYIPLVNEQFSDIELNSVEHSAPTPQISDANFDTDQLRENAGFSSAFFPKDRATDALDIESEEASGHELNYIVVPNQRTLRLIIRSAVSIRRKTSKADSDFTESKKTLDWAARELKRFGATTRMISVELEEPLKQSQHRQLEYNNHTSPKISSSHLKPLAIVRRIEAQFKGQHRSHHEERR